MPILLGSSNAGDRYGQRESWMISELLCDLSVDDTTVFE